MARAATRAKRKGAGDAAPRANGSAKAASRAEENPSVAVAGEAEPLRKRRALSPQARPRAILAAALHEFTAPRYQCPPLPHVAHRPPPPHGPTYFHFPTKQ